MNTLFFDTETTGIPRNYKAPVTDLDNWPRLVQLGWIYYGSEEVIKKELIIKPLGFKIPDSVSLIHGITHDHAMKWGDLLSEVLKEFNSYLYRSDILVGHNLNYDLNVLGAEYIRVLGENPLEGKTTYDTMLKGINVCKLPGKYGQYKWPKLQELYFSLFNSYLAQTHTALDDIENTAKCYFEMKSRGI